MYFWNIVQGVANAACISNRGFSESRSHISHLVAAHRSTKALWDFWEVVWGASSRLNASAAYMLSTQIQESQSAAFLFTFLPARRRRVRFPPGGAGGSISAALHQASFFDVAITAHQGWRLHMQNAQKNKQTNNHTKPLFKPTSGQSVWLYEHGESLMSTVEVFHLCFWTLTPSWHAGAIWNCCCTQVRI